MGPTTPLVCEVVCPSSSGAASAHGTSRSLATERKDAHAQDPLVAGADGGPFVMQFDWEYYLLTACSLALVVIGLLFILSLAM